MPYRVIQWATGQVGRLAIRSIVEHPDLELVGLWVHGDEKHGQDAGTIAGIDPTGVRATTDVDAVLNLEADCVLYAGTDLFRTDEVVNELSLILASGKNVVAAPTVIGYPACLGREPLERLTEACRVGGSTLLGAGISPDGIQALLASLTSHASVDTVEWSEMFDCTPYTDPMTFVALGIGLTTEQEQQQYAPQFMEFLYAPPISLVASMWGASVDGYTHTREVSVATRDVSAPGVEVQKGNVVAVHRRLDALIEGIPRISVHGYYWVGGPDQYPDQWRQPPGGGGYHIDVNGTPNLHLGLAFGDERINPLDAVLIATAKRLANAIPFVCAATPGIKRSIDLPYITSPKWNSVLGSGGDQKLSDELLPVLAVRP